MNIASVILAAGQGVRMRSRLPKVLHPLLGKPMVWYVLDTVRALGCEPTILVIGHGADQVRTTISNLPPPISNLQFVEQHEQRGTGHAVLQARAVLQGKAEVVLVCYADMPLVRAETLNALIQRHTSTSATITMLTLIADDSMSFGRIVRDAEQRVVGIVEERDATPDQRAIRELNCGIYCFAAEWLWEHLPQLQPNARNGEYYLTDLIAMAARESRRIETIVSYDANEMLGINTRVHLAQAEKVMRERINTAWMLAGVTLIDPATTYIEPDVQIGVDTIIEPNTHLRGKTRIGANCRLGPNTIIRDSQVGDECVILASDITESRLAERVRIGPFARLRAGSVIAREVYIGNFGEVKNSSVGEGTHIGHFSYVGDAELGARVNIGAGTITCNFDGKNKHRTTIEDDAFIGSDTMLVAPVRVGARARTGAGSVVNKDVPPDSLAVGVPARVIRRTMKDEGRMTNEQMTNDK